MNHSHQRLSSVKFSGFECQFNFALSGEIALMLAGSNFLSVTKFGFSLRKMRLMHSYLSITLLCMDGLDLLV
jgi:hypothetical protein